MRVGLATSLIAHVVLITLGVMGLHGAEKLEPTEVEAISVDLVPIEEVASLRIGAEESKLIDTPAPAAVDTPTPPQPAERPGATEKDQPIPEETQKANPAPTVRTAPEPVPVPDTPAPPKPEDTPPPAPAPQKQPDPPAEVTPDPVLAEAPTEDPNALPAPPVPAMRPAALQIEKPAPPKPTKTPDKVAETPRETKPADQISDIINTETSRGSTTGSGGQAAAGAPSGQAARLTQSELGALIAQMRKCWSPTLAERNDGVVIRLMVSMNSDGTVAGTPEILTDIGASPILGISARTAARKVAACGPFSLPSDKYDHWQKIDVTLDASQAE